jgi:hypothetical protein
VKQKYTVTKEAENNVLIIREFAELDKDVLSLLCEEKYEDQVIRSALEKGRDKLVASLRTFNFYPPRLYAEKIADLVTSIYQDGDTQSREMLFDDSDFLQKIRERSEPVAVLEAETEEAADLLDDELEDDFIEGDALGSISSPLTVAEDELDDHDDDI